MNYRLWEMQYAGSPKVLWSEIKPTPAQLTVGEVGPSSVR